ncbi:hypothetical protein MNBD_GAMMA15-2091 [hydrothermal vent metagenome]|uniref:Ribosome association toxin RatA n=1 Tax=hydrothermal vent metagenome TaxID=652676 RepID=A0A3B0Z436_9ZZZZ
MINSKASSASRAWIGVCLALWAFGAAAGQVYTALVTHQSGSYFIEVDTLILAPEPAVRRLLTDYANLSLVNSAIQTSVIQRKLRDGSYQVRTVTKACILFYCKWIRQVQNVVESQDGSITAVVIPAKSDFHHGYARVNLWQESAGTRVLIRAEVRPKFWIPPIIGPWLLKRKLRSETLETMQNLERLALPAFLPHNTPSKSLR